ncbi:MAG: hypothetical protein EOP36_03030 [Rubrivivax sp.]|nr:MAG: hypothetical protein EOP36_03030 [Rubrivivax sp.]
MSSFSFSKVAIIQSLDPGEDESGTELGKYIDGLRVAHPTVPKVELINVKGREGFLQAINNLVREAAQNDDCPILQIETHGWEDKTGLAFPDDTSLSWHELSIPLARLNKATGFNLLVCMSACFGGHSLTFVRPNEPSPCFALIGPTDTVYPDELLGSFQALYQELLITLDAGAALAKLNAHGLKKGGFLTITAEDWFFKLADGYLRTHCTKDRLKARAGAIVERLKSEGKALSPSDQLSIEQIGKSLASSFFDRQFQRFFMLGDIPDNLDRFERALVDARHRAEQFMDSQN